MNDVTLLAPPKELFLVPGALYCSADPSIVTTVLGSCVSVCLWDSIQRAGCMIHYVLPLSHDGDRTTRYGDIAIERSVEAMSQLGCQERNVIAKLFGGANVLPYAKGHDTVGEQNVTLALERLQRHGIPLKARRTGGEVGLLVRFHTHTGLAMVKSVGP